MAANCGECLMARVEMVPLSADGSCPKCGAYKAKPAPSLSAELRDTCPRVKDSSGSCAALCDRCSAAAALDAQAALSRDALTALKRVEARLTAAARAFYGDGKRSSLQAALDGWRGEAEFARAVLAKSTKGGS
jgi:hypothetical protein